VDKLYLQKRQRVGYTRYRLNKRGQVILDALKEFIDNKDSAILEIGVSDGQILYKIAEYYNLRHAFGIDISKEAIQAAIQLEIIKPLVGDFINIPFKNESVVFLLALAVLEHIKDVNSALREAYRVLKKGGVFCITLPNPIYDRVNSVLVKTHHVRRYYLKETIRLLQRHRFRVIKSEYFMLWPFWQFPFEEYILNILRLLRLDFMLFNYLVISTKE
jgi:SAM-dependent methyltransferase